MDSGASLPNPVPLSQLAGKLRPLRVSIDVMRPNRSASVAPLELAEVTAQMFGSLLGGHDGSGISVMFGRVIFEGVWGGSVVIELRSQL